MLATLGGTRTQGCWLLCAAPCSQSVRQSCRGLSVVQAVAQILSLLQSSHGQPQVLLQILDLSLAAVLRPTELLARLFIPLASQPLLLHGGSTERAAYDEQCQSTQLRHKNSDINKALV